MLAGREEGNPRPGRTGWSTGLPLPALEVECLFVHANLPNAGNVTNETSRAEIFNHSSLFFSKWENVACLVASAMLLPCLRTRRFIYRLLDNSLVKEPEEGTDPLFVIQSVRWKQRETIGKTVDAGSAKGKQQ